MSYVVDLRHHRNEHGDVYRWLDANCAGWEFAVVKDGREAEFRLYMERFDNLPTTQKYAHLWAHTMVKGTLPDMRAAYKRWNGTLLYPARHYSPCSRRKRSVYLGIWLK